MRSIRASTVQELVETGETDDVIKTRTGHSSDRAVSQYKRPRQMETQLRVSKVLTGGQPKAQPNNDEKINMIFIILAILTTVNVIMYLYVLK